MGKQENKIQLFQNQNVRTHWNEENEKWYFSVQVRYSLFIGRKKGKVKGGKI